MREFKFRAWDKKEKELLKPQTIQFLMVSVLSKRVVEDFEMMQYTGATDIYEADIIEFFLNDEYSDDNITMPEETVHIGIIVFKWGGWFVKTLDNDYLWLERIIECSDTKVIGNIYENPELLEQR